MTICTIHQRLTWRRIVVNWTDLCGMEKETARAVEHAVAFVQAEAGQLQTELCFRQKLEQTLPKQIALVRVECCPLEDPSGLVGATPTNRMSILSGGSGISPTASGFRTSCGHRSQHSRQAAIPPASDANSPRSRRAPIAGSQQPRHLSRLGFG